MMVEIPKTFHLFQVVSRMTMVESMIATFNLPLLTLAMTFFTVKLFAIVDKVPNLLDSHVLDSSRNHTQVVEVLFPAS